MTQVPFSLMQRILLQTPDRVRKKSGVAPMKSILSVTANQAMSLNATRINDTKIHYQGFILAFWFTSRYERE